MKNQINMLSLFKKKVFSYPFENYPQYSRIHKLKNFSSANTIYVKRDDELGFGASGSKLRKYLSLIPYIINHSFQEVIVIGGAYSNNILTAVQLLIENEVKPILFFPETKNDNLIGNYLLTSLLMNSEDIHFLNENEYKNFDHVIKKYCDDKKNHGIQVGVIQEGGNMKESLPGALTLSFDILKNENENNLEFDHIFIDSGTGLMSTSLLLAFSYLNKKTEFHILQVAGNKNEFEHYLKIHMHNFKELFKVEIEKISKYTLYIPSNAKSFGATNTTVFQTIIDLSKKNGMITDPIYSAKLFYEGKKIIEKNNLTGNILFVHSGGGLSLFGFQNELKKNMAKMNETKFI